MTPSPVFRSPKAWAEFYDTHVVNPLVQENRFLAMSWSTPGRLLPFSKAKQILPDPFWAEHDTTIDCYWRAWELAFQNLKQPTAKNDFVSNYCDSAFNGNLFMWDAAFVTAYGLYGRRAFNFQGTLDNFYRKQHPDGFICREIAESNGQDTFQRFDPSSTGPDVLGWAEWNYYLKTGQKERLEAVFAPLLAYHQWLRRYHTWPDGSYWSTGWGCGMDNLPRVESPDDVNWSHGNLTWVDATLQAILSARVLLEMGLVLGRQAELGDVREELQRLSKFVNKFLWDEERQFYCDRRPDGHLSSMKHIGAYWALLARCVPPKRLRGFVNHLDNPVEFNRLHRIPALSADDPAFQGMGDYWCGGVWAPTNYMVLKGLDQNGQQELAHQIALNHVSNVVQVFTLEDTHWEGAEQFQQFFHLDGLQFDDKHTLWENYAPDHARPGGKSKPGYVGWTGLPPIAVLFEDVFGLDPQPLSQRLTWRIRLLEAHGIRRYPLGDEGLVDLKCESRKSLDEIPQVEIHSNMPLTLDIIWEGGAATLKIEKES